MKRLKITVIFIFLLSFISIGENEFKNIAENTRIIQDNVVELVTKQNITFRDSKWPEDVDKNKVSREEIPSQVIEHCEKWIKEIIKDRWVPQDIIERLRGLRKKQPYEADCLLVRYSKSGTRIQIQEDGAVLGILIDPNSLDKRDDIKQYLIESLYQYFNFPQSLKDRIVISYTIIENEGNAPLYYGIVNCDYDITRKDEWKRRVWWSDTFFWTDGGIIYFSFVEYKENKPKDVTHAKPGSLKRFKTEKPFGKN
jgi:hypothetical protein